jgi:hypothetical protein
MMLSRNNGTKGVRCSEGQTEVLAKADFRTIVGIGEVFETYGGRSTAVSSSGE